MPEDRRLAAIMFTDIVGYTALMGSDEDKAFKVLRKNREIQRPIIKKFRGEWLKEMGDGILASFTTASDAVRCAGEIQQAVKKEGIALRIGIHTGEVVFEGHDVLGDGVNVASRLEEMAEEGCINISGAVYKDIKNKAGITAEFIEEKELKNVEEPVKVYKVHYEEGDRKEELTKGEESQKARNKLPYYIITGLIVVIAGILIWKFLPSKDTSSQITETATEALDKSIAVLPFINDSPDKENEYFCNGMMEEILTHLQRIADLRVKSRTDIEQYRDEAKTTSIIGAELGVAFILEGSVRKAGDNLRITAQLIDVKTGDHLWADTYDGKYTDAIFEFQSDVAKKVASSLHAIITPEEEKRIEGKPTREVIAWDLLWRGMEMFKYYWQLGDTKYLDSAHHLFDWAIAVDPNYSSSYYGKGHAYAMVNEFDSAIFYAQRVIDLDPEDFYGYYLMGEIYNRMGNKEDLAFEYFKKAVDLGTDNPWAFLMLGLAYCNNKNDFKKGLPNINKALKLDGRAQNEIYAVIGGFFRDMGDYSKAIEYYKYTLSMQIGCLGISSYSVSLFFQGKYSEAEHFLDSICNVSVCERQCIKQKFYIHLGRKEFLQAEQYYSNFIEAGGTFYASDSIRLAFVYKGLGREQEAMTILKSSRLTFEKRLAELETFWIYFDLSLIHAIQDDKAEALRYLSEAEKSGFRTGWQDYIEIYPPFENFWNDPEFKAIVKRTKDEKAAQREIVKEMIESGEIDL